MNNFNLKSSIFGLFRKLLVFALILSLFSSSSVTVLTAADKTARIYVNASASDGGSGTKEKPYNCLTDVLEELNYNLAFGNYSGNVEVIFAGGVYSFNSTVRITGSHSGRESVRITYKAADGEKVVFSGSSDANVLSGSLIELSNASYITFDGICFTDNLNAPLLSVKGNNVSVVNCTFSDTGTTLNVSSPEKGYALSLNGSNITVTDCEIDGANGGIFIKGGRLENLTSSGNSVRENRIHHVTGCAVYVDGAGSDVLNNTITDARCAVDIAGALHNVKYNRFVGISESAVHTAGSPVTAGLDISYNFIDDVKDAAVSLPMGTSYSSVHHNIIRNSSVGIYLGGGRALTVENNVLIFDSAKHAHPHAVKYDMSFAEVIAADAVLYDSVVAGLNSAGYGSDTWLEHFPQTESITVPESFYETDNANVFYNPAESVIRNNAFYTSGDVKSVSFTVTGKNAGHDVYQKRYGFIHSNAQMPRGSMTDFPLADFGIYSLKSNAAVFSRISGFEDIPFEKMGDEITVIPFPFVDVKDSDWYYKWAYYVQANGLMKGTDTAGTLFSPNVTATRAMLVQILYNMEGSPDVDFSNKFTDVREDAWYASAVMWASRAGITSGTSEDTFSPDKALTREQLAVFLYRYLRDYKKITPSAGISPDTFTDAGEISPYPDFREALSWALGEGILTGKSTPYGLRLAPGDTAVRSEAAAMLSRFCINLKH